MNHMYLLFPRIRQLPPLLPNLHMEYYGRYNHSTNSSILIRINSCIQPTHLYISSMSLNSNIVGLTWIYHDISTRKKSSFESSTHYLGKNSIVSICTSLILSHGTHLFPPADIGHWKFPHYPNWRHMVHMVTDFGTQQRISPKYSITHQTEEFKHTLRLICLDILIQLRILIQI